MREALFSRLEHLDVLAGARVLDLYSGSGALGLEAASLMTGAAVVEYVFAWPGIGKMAVDAALVRDIPVVVGFAVAAGLIYVVVNLAVDIAVVTLDPRVRSL